MGYNSISCTWPRSAGLLALGAGLLALGAGLLGSPKPSRPPRSGTINARQSLRIRLLAENKQADARDIKRGLFD